MNGIAGRRGLAALVWKEIELLLRRPLWKIAAVALVGSLVVGSATATARRRSELIEQERSLSLLSTELSGLSLAEAVTVSYPTIKAPWRLSFLVDGGQVSTPDLYRQQLNPAEASTLSRSTVRSDRLPNAPPLDCLLVVRWALSLFAFTLCCDRIGGERTTGTLQLLLSYPIPRWKILAGKLLAAWSCMAAPLVIGAAGGIGWMMWTMGWSREELIKAASVLCLVLWALGLFVAFSLLVSSLFREVADSFNVLLLVWVALVLVAPALAAFGAQRLRHVPPQAQVERRLKDVKGEIERYYDEHDDIWRSSALASQDNFSWERRSAEATSRLFRRQERIRRQVLVAKLRQVELARDLAAISPMFLVQGIAERLAGTGVLRDRRFLTQAWQFREILADAIKRQDARDPVSPHILFFRDYMSKRPLAVSELPRFTFREATFREGLVSAFPWLLLLALETVLVIAAAIWAFERYDVGRSGER